METLFLHNFLRDLGATNLDNDYIRLKNPFDKSSHKNMVVSLKFNFVQDWKTGYSTNVTKFIADYLNISYSEALSLTGEFSTPIQLKKSLQVTNNGLTLPNNDFLFEDTYWAGVARDYLLSRDMDLYNLILKGWCVGTEGKWTARLIIPFKDSKGIYYYIGRTIKNDDPKYLNPKAEDVQINKSDVLYNKSALIKYDEGYLVEGVTDAEQIGDNAIASLGWKLSPNQIRFIRESRWKKLNIILDRGAEYRGVSTALNFVDKMEVNLFTVPEEFKDVQESKGKIIFYKKM